MWVAIVLVLVIGGFALYISVSGIPSYDVVEFEYEAQATPENLERGQKLTMTLCAGCHMNRETGKLTGRHMLDSPPEFGFAYSPNITQDVEHGIGAWKDADIVRLLRTGIKPDGAYAPPWMAKLPLLADEDMEAIVAFLRSDSPLMAADATPDKPCEPSFLAKFLSHVAFKPLPMPEGPIGMPDETNQVELGEYVANNLECFSCHSATFETNDYLTPSKSEGYYGGGNAMVDMDGNTIYTANITPHETGIGTWSKEEFIKAVKTGVVPEGNALRAPMPPYPLMSDEEIGAIYAYLQTITPIDNEISRTAPE